VVKSGLQGMTVRGVKKRSYWKFNESMHDWVECPNLPVSYEDVYLERGFRKSPPEKKDVTITESSNIGNRRTQEPVKNTR
jgi:hypothetical protein